LLELNRVPIQDPQLGVDKDLQRHSGETAGFTCSRQASTALKYTEFYSWLGPVLAAQSVSYLPLAGDKQ
ncbi:unnamed protein product, partial [Coregonus sp. 'balchen']